MNKYTKKELAAKANKVMKDHGCDECFATEDGQFFTHINRAKLHAFSNGKMKVFEYGSNASSDVDEDSETKPKKGKSKAEDIIAAIEKAESISEVEELITGEKRKTVLAAAEKQITDIKSNAARAAEGQDEEE